jgi:hypothetical protein
MTGLNLIFDPNAHEPSGSQKVPVPAGNYLVAVDKTEIKDNKEKDGRSTGKHLSITYKIVDGEFANNTLTGRYNLVNDSPDAVKIAHEELSAVCHVIGYLQPINLANSAAELIGGRLRVDVTNDGRYNEIKRVTDVNGNPASRGGSRGGAVMPSVSTPVATAYPTQPATVPVPATAWAAPAAPAPIPQAVQPAPAPAWNPTAPQPSAPWGAPQQ